MTLFVVVCTPLLLSLAYWQLERGRYKETLYQAYLAELAGLPVPPDQDALAVPFRRLALRGRFGPEVFLVDNQVHAGRPGYWMVQVFETRNGMRLLTNRGFVSAGPDRAELPALPDPGAEVRLTGVVWPFTGLPPLLAEDRWTGDWPRRVQRLDIHRMADMVAAMPVEVRLEGDPSAVPQPAPFGQRLEADRHFGYAATWLGLAVTLLLLYGVQGRRTARANLAVPAGQPGE